MHFIDQKLDDYVVAHTQKEPELLTRLTRQTYLQTLQPRMLSGAYQGRLLSMLSKIVNPINILEIGTFTGYATLCLAEGIQSQGELHTIECNEEIIDLAQGFFDQSTYAQQIHLHLGDALDIIPKLSASFDLVFIDADKPNYINYFEAIISKMNKGGIILSDNVLWSGKVIEPLAKGDVSTEALLAYNKFLVEDPRVETVLLPIRDGLTVSRVL